MVSVLRTLRHLGAAMVLLMSISLPLAAATHAQEQISDNELVVYTAKKIITMEPAMPEASAVAVADGRIVAVGTLE